MRSHVLKRLFEYFRPYMSRLIFVFVAAAVSTLFAVLAPAVMGGITTELFDGITAGAFDWDMIVYMLVTLAACYVVSQIFSYMQSVSMNKIMAGIMRKMRADICQKMHRLPIGYYDAHTKGEILSTITNDVDTLNNALGQNLSQIVTQVITAVGIFVMMLNISLLLTVIAVLTVPIALGAAKGVMRLGMRHYAEQQELIGRMNGFVEEAYRGHDLIQTYGHKECAKADFDSLNSALCRSARSAESASGKVTPITDMVNNIGYVFSAVFGCFSVINGGMSLGDVQAMLQYTKQFSQPFTSIAGMAGSFGSAMAAAGRIFGFLDEKEEAPDRKEAITPFTYMGEVRFEHVSFGYTKDRMLMKDVNISVRQGQKVAIVGPTGAGKTTLINLLMRFYDVDSGAVYVDGVDIRNMTRKELRSRFGMVLQDTWLFEGSIKDNIAYSDENMDDERVVKAAVASGADSFINTLPRAYDFILTDEAENISQGQKQLLTIARAMAADPEIMILDEATSNVDTQTERMIQRAMAKLMKGRTSFVIAHRLSTILDSDMILYMENGNIEESGTHEELIQKKGKYAALYSSQFA